MNFSKVTHKSNNLSRKASKALPQFHLKQAWVTRAELERAFGIEQGTLLDISGSAKGDFLFYVKGDRRGEK